MADYYTQFSFILPCHEELATQLVEVYFEDKDAADDNSDDWYEKFGSIDVSVDPKGVWVRDDSGDGNIEAAIYVTQYYLKTVGHPGQGILITWANACSKPRPGAFSGGAALVTADDVEVARPIHDLELLASESGIEIINSEY